MFSDMFSEPEPEHEVLARDLINKLTVDQTALIKRILSLADDAAPGDAGVKMALLYMFYLNGLFGLYAGIVAYMDVPEKEVTGSMGKAIFTRLMKEVSVSGWRYMVYAITGKKEPSK